MINRFSQFLVEEEKTVYFTFGRMNPPTIGHGKVLDTLAVKAGRNPYRVHVSQTQDKTKNPLQYKSKVKHLRKMFPKHARSVLTNIKIKTALDAAVALYDEGFKTIAMVTGSDRIREFDVLLNKYNGKKSRHGFYNFSKITVISAGQRDPDSEGVEGMSASKQRDNAKGNDFTAFAQGLPKALSNPDAKRLFNDVRKGLGLKEAKEFKNHIQLESVSDTREAFVKGRLFNLDEQVIIKKTDEVGTITFLGSNYVIVETPERKTRQWLDAIEKIEEYANLPDDGTPQSTAKAKSITPGQMKEYGGPKISRKDYLKQKPMGEGDGLWHNIRKRRAAGKPKLKPGDKNYPKTLDIEAIDHMQNAKGKIDKEKTRDAIKHDRLIDRARLARARQKNRATTGEPSK